MMERSSVFLSILSGILLSAGFPKPEMFYVSWVALVPLFFALKGKSPKEAFLLGYLCGMAHYLTAMYWIHYVIQHYGGLPFLAAATVLVLLCVYLAVYPAIFAFLARLWEPHPLLWALGLPCAWVMLELARAYALTGFPWANLGYTQTPFLPLIQISDITGVYGVSWLIVFANTTISSCIRGTRGRLLAPVLGVILIAVVSYGFWRIQDIALAEKDALPWTVAVIQGNVDQSKKWDPAFQQETLSRYERLSKAAAGQSPTPDLIVWPETSAPFFYGREEDLTRQINGIFRQIDKPVLFGSPAAELIKDKAKLLNRAYLVDGRSPRPQMYAKQHLVPFGEYVPYQEVLFFVSKLVEAAGDFASGNDPSPLTLNGRSFGVLICYEGVFPEISRATVERGATALMNMTNDAWYGDTSAPYQHLQISLWRAVEFRVPLVRAANTGISTIVDATGRKLGTIPLHDEGFLVGTVHPLRMMTLYARWGNLFAILCVFIALGGILYSMQKRRSA